MSLLLSGSLLIPVTMAQQDRIETTRKIVVRTVPVCPDLARRINLQGSVKLLVTVAANGTVKSVEVRGGHPLLANAAQLAVHEWRWSPAESESKEVVEMKFQRK